MKPAKVDLLAEQRDAKFKKWLQEKELRDKAQEYMSKLDTKRADDEESLKEVAIAMCAIDKMLESDETAGAAELGIANEAEAPKRIQKTMKSVWMKWASEHHKFNNIKLSDADYAAFSGAVKEFLEMEPGPDGKNIYFLQSLKYTFPAAPKAKGEKPRPLTNDQKQQNLMFVRCAKKLWKEVKEEMQARVIEHITRARLKRAGIDAESKDAKSSGPQMIDFDDGSAGNSRLEYNALYDLSMKRLREWVEEDEDKAAEAQREVRLEKMAEAKVSHEQFVKHKDSLRIRLPDDLAAPQAPAMSYGRIISSVRPKGGPGPVTTVELMAGSGLKYVHATGRGRQGLDGDLEKSRKQLIKMGLIVKENFDAIPDSDFSMDKYHDELENNPVIAEKKRDAEKWKEDNAKSYDAWVVVKELREQAVKLLSYISLGDEDENGHGESVRGSVTSLGSRNQGAKSSSDARRSSTISLRKSVTGVSAAKHQQQVELAIEVGKALKRVDRSLFAEWTAWCVPKCISFRVAQVMWDAFEPKACDVHSSAYSQVRETFNKLLKPGVDYKKTFVDFATKIMRRKQIQAESKEEREKFLGELTLTKKTLGELLLEMGIVMKPAELLVLVDAFDANGDGVITMQEFLDFTGPKRDKKGGSLMLIGQRCSWLTTCKLTGMANAYSVSAVKPNMRLTAWAEETSKAGDSKVGEGDGGDGEAFDGITGKMVIKTLKNGEKRMCAENAERVKRQELLRKFNLISEDDAEAKKKGDEDAKDAYEDDYEPEYENEFEGEHKKSGGEIQEPCQFIKWSDSNRKEGIKILTRLSREARQEAWLSERMTNGSCPSKPNLELEDPNDVKDQDDSFDPTRELQLSWAPGVKGELISFFLLETAGEANGLLRSESYKELCRDPPDANPNSAFQCSFRVCKLEPATTYAFRLRAYNGFGPGAFVYKTFTTLTAAPLVPRIVRVAHDSVLLRWIFSRQFMERLAELKRLFQAADRDRSGCLSRDELAQALDGATGSLEEFMQLVRKRFKLREWGGLFDMIEQDENGTISWEEFEHFFMSSGWDDEVAISAAKDKTTAVINPYSAGTAVGGTGTLRASVAGSVKPSPPTGASKVSNVTYIVEKCVSEKLGEAIFEKVAETSTGQVLIPRLTPGQSYKFRVFAINASGQAGSVSDCVIVHTMLETPEAPVCLPKNVGPTKVTINWKVRRQHQSSRDQAVVSRMIGEWAGSLGSEDTGVNITDAFRKYDRNGDGTIDPDELAVLLDDLNIDATPDRLADAFAQFDQNGDGVITFDEFAAWWRREEVVYVLKRSEPILPSQSSSIRPDDASATEERATSRGRRGSASGVQDNMSQTGNSVASRKSLLSASNAFNRLSRTKAPGSAAANGLSGALAVSGTGVIRNVALPVTVYRGEKAGQVVGGLIPNKLYHFRLRYCGSRCNSEISPPLVLMTAPMDMTNCPVLISVTSSIARVKWYSPPYGAYKFIVQLRGIDRAAAARVNSAPTTAIIDTTALGGLGGSDIIPTENGWTTVFCAFENNWTSTALASDCEYEVRVLSLNCQGIPSKPSPTLSLVTLPRTAAGNQLSVRNASSHFAIDCTHDIVVGDTILITERIFSVPTDGGISSNAPSAAASLAGSRAGLGAVDGGVRGSAANSKLAFGSKSGIKSVTPVPNSLIAHGQRNELTNPVPGGVFLGERTIVAYVVKDNYRWLRDFLPAAVAKGAQVGTSGALDALPVSQYASGLVAQSQEFGTQTQNLPITADACRRVANMRNLWLEVVSQRSSSEQCKPYDLKPGTILQRLQSNIEQFQVFRSAWEGESGRKPQWDEWTGLSECYLQTDC